jgi:DNA-binding transcriptional MerR regulator
MEIQTPSGATIPDKLYFKIGEVTELTDLAAYVLRFWESEFPIISPKRTNSGQRLYRRSDVELILKIKYLLYDKKFTIPGAKKILKNHNRQHVNEIPLNDLDEIKTELRRIRTLLE